MREILFKAKRIDNGEWVEGYYAKGATRHCILSSLAEVHRYDIDKKTLCQYTGLKDSNGNKVWENDIVKIDKQFLTGTFKVVFNKSAFEYLNAITFDEVNHYVNAKECVEVIGNIFDNPELMGVQVNGASK